MTVWIGTSGWQYRHWRGRFYPAGLPQRAWLEHYAECFATVEVNATFYRLPSPAAVEDWRRRTPEDFVMAVKVSRYLTHVRRLRAPREPVDRFMGVVEALGPRLGPVLLQLPPDMRCDTSALEGWAARLAEHFDPGDDLFVYRRGSPGRGRRRWRRMPTRPCDGPGSARERDWRHLRKG